MTIQTFIFVHDQEIILDFLKKNRFLDFENLTYVLVGKKSFDKVENFSNVIIAQKYEDNLEDYPNLTSYTGWYILWKNNLINSDYVNLFEYDINYVKDFTKKNIDLIQRNHDFIGYFPMSVSDPVYIKMSQFSDDLVNQIKLKTNVEIEKMINEIWKNNFFATWSSSSNSTWKTESWKKYMDWFYQFLDVVKLSKFSGHMHERSLSFFYRIYNLNVLDTNNLMIHLQLNTHGTSPLPQNRFNQLYNTLL